MTDEKVRTGEGKKKGGTQTGGGRVKGSKNGQRLWENQGCSIPKPLYPAIMEIVNAWKEERRAHFALRGPAREDLIKLLSEKGL